MGRGDSYKLHSNIVIILNKVVLKTKAWIHQQYNYSAIHTFGKTKCYLPSFFIIWSPEHIVQWRLFSTRLVLWYTWQYKVSPSGTLLIEERVSEGLMHFDKVPFLAIFFIPKWIILSGMEVIYSGILMDCPKF